MGVKRHKAIGYWLDLECLDCSRVLFNASGYQDGYVTRLLSVVTSEWMEAGRLFLCCTQR